MTCRPRSAPRRASHLRQPHYRIHRRRLGPWLRRPCVATTPTGSGLRLGAPPTDTAPCRPNPTPSPPSSPRSHRAAARSAGTLRRLPTRTGCTGCPHRTRTGRSPPSCRRWANQPLPPPAGATEEASRHLSRRHRGITRSRPAAAGRHPQPHRRSPGCPARPHCRAAPLHPGGDDLASAICARRRNALGDRTNAPSCHSRGWRVAPAFVRCRRCATG